MIRAWASYFFQGPFYLILIFQFFKLKFPIAHFFWHAFFIKKLGLVPSDFSLFQFFKIAFQFFNFVQVSQHNFVLESCKRPPRRAGSSPANDGKGIIGKCNWKYGKMEIETFEFENIGKWHLKPADHCRAKFKIWVDGWIKLEKRWNLSLKMEYLQQ